jgi:hypothetical protein
LSATWKPEKQLEGLREGIRHYYEEMKQIDLFSMTPLDALNRLADLQRRIGPTEQDKPPK